MQRLKHSCGVFFLIVLSGACSVFGVGNSRRGHVLTVGPGSTLERPSMAAKVACDGDTIEIAAGTYPGDVAVWRRSNLTIRGVNGRAHLKANGAAAEGKAIWVIKGRNTTVESIEFSGAKVRDRNGAGIRQEGADLTVRNCYFHDNEMGILTGTNLESEIVIERSEFANSSVEPGRTTHIGHNIYIGAVRRFTLRASYSHHARIGHNVKSRARENYLLYNQIADGPDGTASYEVELPNGGLSFLIGNLIQQGPKTENDAVVSYGAEGLAGGVNELYVVNNTIVNDRPAGGRFIVVAPRTQLVTILNNVFAGPGTVLVGPGQPMDNVQVADAGFVDRTHYDYHLKRGSPAIDAGRPAGEAHGFALTPVAQYVPKCGEEPRPTAGALDCGAYEFLQ